MVHLYTFITDTIEASGNNVALIMSYSGHKSLESFKIYLHAPTQGCIAADQCSESVGLFLASFAGMKGIEGTPGTVDEEGKPLEKQKIAVS
jgi:hypothetical protein